MSEDVEGAAEEEEEDFGGLMVRFITIPCLHI